MNSPIKLFQAKRRVFPDPAVESIDGIVAMGDQLSVATLFEAYSFGIFPWPHPELPTLWYSPDPRGVIDFSELHIPKSLKKFLRSCPFRVTFNTCFKQVMVKCSQVPRPGQDGTWINSGLMKAYEDFHRAGYAHSIEVWNGEKLVGGLYGTYVAGLFAGESMFFEESNASKLALLSIIDVLMAQGHKWMDIQMVTPVTESFGGKYIPRDEYFERLKKSKATAKPLELPVAGKP